MVLRAGPDRYKFPPGNNPSVREPFNRTMQRPSPKIILMLFENGKSIFMSPNNYFETGEVTVFPNESRDRIVNFQYNSFNFRGKTLLSDSYLIAAFCNTDAEVDSIDRLFRVILVSFLLLAVISLFLSRHLAFKVLKPIQKSYEEQVHFVQDASHEIRTPLAIIKSKLQLMAMHPDDTIGDHIEDISHLMGELRGIEKLNKDLLTLSKEDVDTSICKTQFNLSSLMHELYDFYRVLAQVQGKKFELIMPADISIFQDYQKIKQAVTILLENAFKYTSSSDNITLRCEKTKHNIIISVRDTGIGIMEKDMERIFERFFRSEDVRAKGISGSGIGLSLLKSMSRVLDFSIDVKSGYGTGTEFILVFRLNKIVGGSDCLVN